MSRLNKQRLVALSALSDLAAYHTSDRFARRIEQIRAYMDAVVEERPPASHSNAPAPATAEPKKAKG